MHRQCWAGTEPNGRTRLSRVPSVRARTKNQGDEDNRRNNNNNNNGQAKQKPNLVMHEPTLHRSGPHGPTSPDRFRVGVGLGVHFALDAVMVLRLVMFVPGVSPSWPYLC